MARPKKPCRADVLRYSIRIGVPGELGYTDYIVTPRKGAKMIVEEYEYWQDGTLRHYGTVDIDTFYRKLEDLKAKS